MGQSYSRSTLLRLGAIGLSVLGTLVTMPLLMRTLGEYQFGLWGMVAATTTYLLLMDFGIALACTRYLSLQSGQPQHWDEIISNSLLLSFMISALLLACALAVWLWYPAPATDAGILPAIIAIVLVEVAVSIPLRMYQSILRTEMRYVDIGLFEIIRVGLRTAGIALLLLLGAGLLTIVIASSIINVLFFVLGLLSVWFRHRRLFFLPWTLSREKSLELLQFSKFTALSQAAEFLKFRTDSILVSLLLGINAAAHYTIIVMVVMLHNQVLMRFMSYWDTLIIRQVGARNEAAAIEAVHRSLTIGMAISLLCLTGTIMIGKPFLGLWMGTEYTKLHLSLILLTLVLPGIVVQMATTPYFNAIGRQKLNSQLDITEIFFKLLLIYPLSKLAGLEGFIMAILLPAFMFSICGRLYFLRKNTTGYPAGLSKKQKQSLTLTLLISLLFLGIYFQLDSRKLAPESLSLLLSGMMAMALSVHIYKTYLR
ncbi:MAG: lipopolysaccharide biosynthesis protein [Thiothrix sp.]|nr:lipopolysaccharide biosynthesis protein [Thiothrix sp.]HPE61920.1 lipopolysaccharide biosynthesis protein [Thiolinea sp.]